MKSFRLATDQIIRRLLFRIRIFTLSTPTLTDPYSPEYLYLAQQSKRVALSATIGRFSRYNLLLWPLFGVIVVARLTDLIIANAIIGSYINETQLMNMATESSDNNSPEDAPCSKSDPPQEPR